MAKVYPKSWFWMHAFDWPEQTLNTRRPKPRSLTQFGEWKDPRDSVLAISQFVVSWISLTNFANIKNSVGSIAQSTQPLKTTLPKSYTIRIFEHFRSIVDDSTPCFFSCDVWRLSLFRIQSKSVSWEGHLPQIQKKLLQVYHKVCTITVLLIPEASV